jgi:hypothetical protein
MQWLAFAVAMLLALWINFGWRFPISLAASRSVLSHLCSP